VDVGDTVIVDVVVGESVGVAVSVAVRVGVTIAVGEGVGVMVAVCVAVGSGVGVAVCVAVGALVIVGEAVAGGGAGTVSSVSVGVRLPISEGGVDLLNSDRYKGSPGGRLSLTAITQTINRKARAIPKNCRLRFWAFIEGSRAGMGSTSMGPGALVCCVSVESSRVLWPNSRC